MSRTELEAALGLIERPIPKVERRKHFKDAQTPERFEKAELKRKIKQLKRLESK